MLITLVRDSVKTLSSDRRNWGAGIDGGHMKPRWAKKKDTNKAQDQDTPATQDQPGVDAEQIDLSGA